ncbi:MAG: hypothetical protein HQM10_13740 [Candidatus Riflebacteria bacterium]|nr:hypothetical protein [Candidatus Riflebacteria bacterium]
MALYTHLNTISMAAFYIFLFLSAFDSENWKYFLISAIILFVVSLFIKIKFNQDELPWVNAAARNAGSGLLLYSVFRLAAANNNPLGSISSRENMIPLALMFICGLISLIISKYYIKNKSEKSEGLP